jgi:thioesterase domain-containing protein
MAHQLAERHEEVRLLFLLDPSAKLTPADVDPGSRGTVPRMGSRIREVARNLIGAARLKLERTITRMRCQSYVLTHRILPPALRSAYILDIYARARRLHAPRPYAGRVVIFKSRNMEYTPPWDWRNLMTGQLKMYESPAGHEDFTKEAHIREWASKLNDALSEASSSVDARGHQID